METSQDITDRQKLEEALSLNELQMHSLLQLNEKAERPTQLIAEYALEKAIESTSSKTGYLAFLNADGTLRSMHSWPKEQRAAGLAPRTYPVGEARRWEEVVRKRGPVIANRDAPPLSFETGAPKEVVSVRSMDVPIFEGPRIVAVAGVGNKETPYGENDVGQLTLLMLGMWRLVQRKQSEEELRSTAEALRRSEVYLAEAQRVTHTGSWAGDCSFRPLYWSEELYRIYGFDPNQGLPSHDQTMERIHPDDREGVMQGFYRVIHQKVDADVEYRIVLPDGTLKYALGIGHPVLDAQGELVEIVGTTVDITERKQTGEALRRSEAYLAEAQKLTHTGSWAGDCFLRPSYWSEEHYRIFGLDPEQGLQSRDQPLERIHPDDRNKVLEAFERVIHQKEDCGAEFRIVFPDGTLKYVHSIGHPVLDAHGDLVEIVGTTVDITERKRTEEALRRSQSYLAEAQRLTHTGSWAGDASLQPSYWSEEHYRIFGLDPEQGLPTREQPLERIHPDDRNKVIQAFDAAIIEKLNAEVFYRIALPDGTVKYAHALGHPVLDANGDLVEVIGTTVDITARRRAEEERARLHQLEADLAHINRVSMMGELTASIAHEVNQPLSGVVSNGSACLRWLAGDEPNLDEAREAARRIVRDGKRAAEIIARIRSLTKRKAAHRETLDLNETILEVLPLVGDEAKKRGVTIRTSFAVEVFPIVGDRVQLQQVVLNLVMNGMEAMSTVTDRARELVITSRNAERDQVEVSIEDSGIGVEPDQSAKIFDAFYTTKPTGMGMGLSICRSILLAHGGRLWATANDGPGATFHFSLPKETREPDAELARV